MAHGQEVLKPAGAVSCYIISCFRLHSPCPLSLRDVQGGIPIPRFSTHIPKFTEISQKLDDIQYAGLMTEPQTVSFGIITKFLISYSILDTRPPWGSGCISTYPPYGPRLFLNGTAPVYNFLPSFLQGDIDLNSNILDAVRPSPSKILGESRLIGLVVERRKRKSESILIPLTLTENRFVNQDETTQIQENGRDKSVKVDKVGENGLREVGVEESSVEQLNNETSKSRRGNTKSKFSNRTALAKVTSEPYTRTAFLLDALHSTVHLKQHRPRWSCAYGTCVRWREVFEGRVVGRVACRACAAILQGCCVCKREWETKRCLSVKVAEVLEEIRRGLILGGMTLERGIIQVSGLHGSFVVIIKEARFGHKDDVAAEMPQVRAGYCGQHSQGTQTDKLLLKELKEAVPWARVYSLFAAEHPAVGQLERKSGEHGEVDMSDWECWEDPDWIIAADRERASSASGRYFGMLRGIDVIRDGDDVQRQRDEGGRVSVPPAWMQASPSTLWAMSVTRSTRRTIDAAMALNVFHTRRRLNRTAVSSIQPKIASKSSTGISDISLRASTLRVASSSGIRGSQS
ncbi:hypothetical protein B0H14DRAFT_3132386 [Mycena olivaceomarginata]|nr:hypothetical protein B0H14DRAFT_3132386 [Mycena olivaceomarginata]